MEYNPRTIERKWQAFWKAHNTYAVSNHSPKPKYYILDMFPYPSGAGLHVGHPLGYIASDIFARYKRHKGFNVLHPMGFDSFGLPAEQYAIQTGIHPEVATEKNIKRYREQLDNIGFSFDWSREVRTSDPAYYKWTQWIFMQLFNHYYNTDLQKAMPIDHLKALFAEKGNRHLAAACDEETPIFSADEWKAFSEKEGQTILLHYRLTYPGESFVNWCPELGTVLSNDEVIGGVSERGGFPVERKKMKQWSMRLTAYADRLLEGLDELDWSDSIKEQQRNWIGKSEGASVKFPLENSHRSIEVFTTRVDTIFGVSFLVLAPEHEWVGEITTQEQQQAVEHYQQWASTRSEIERMSETRKVTGAFTGAYATHPFTGNLLPIYIADYVLAAYGTGAVMAVPSGDQRDWNFAAHFNLPIIPISDAQKNLEAAADPTKAGRYINSGIITGLTYAEAVPTLISWLEKKGLGAGKTQYKLRNVPFSRQRYWGEPLPVYFVDGLPQLIKESELPLLLPPVDKYLPTASGEPPLGRAIDWKYKAADGQSYPYELSTMPGWAGSSWYFYRYMDVANENACCGKEALHYWKSVDLYLGGSEHAVGHLLYSRFWNHFLYDIGIAPEREYAKKLINQGMIQGKSSFVFRAKEGFFEEYLRLKVLEPLFSDLGPQVSESAIFEDRYVFDFSFQTSNLVIEVVSCYHSEAIENLKQKARQEGKRLLVLFSETIMEHVNEPEAIGKIIREALDKDEPFVVSDQKPPYKQLFVSRELTHKYDPDALTKLHTDVSLVEVDVLDIDRARNTPAFEGANFKVEPSGKFLCSSEVEKMSKSKYNVVNPDDMVEQYGADCFRMYEMFLGPIEMSKPWDTKGITGVSGFLKKFWSLYVTPEQAFVLTQDLPSREELFALHSCIRKVTEDLERFSMNTCVSHFMICTNELKRLKCSKRVILEPLIVLLSPFAPHVAEELWQLAGNPPSVCDAPWPRWEADYLQKEVVEYPVQINGKMRGTFSVEASANAEEIEARVVREEFVKKHLEGQVIRKFIVVPGRIINIVAAPATPQ
jgi:leucyl-tRNA synthetase